MFSSGCSGQISGHHSPWELCPWLDVCVFHGGETPQAPGGGSCPIWYELDLETITSRVGFRCNTAGVQHSASAFNFLQDEFHNPYVSLCFSCCCRYCSSCLCMFSCFSHLSTVSQT